MRPCISWATMALSAAIGCGGSTATDGSGSGNAATGATGGATSVDFTEVTVSTWVMDLTAAYCTWAIRCGKFADGAACNAYMGPQFAVINFNAPSAAITAVSKGTAQFDPTQAASCLTTLSNLDCDVDLLHPTSIPAPCTAVFSGSVSDGNTCVDDVECANGSMCYIVSTATCEGMCRSPSGTNYCRTNADCPAQQYCESGWMEGSGLWGWGSCEAFVPPGATEGDLCGTPVQCAPGLYCGTGPAPARCGASAAAGVACGGWAGPSCAPGLACDTSDDGTTATCMPPAKLGQACTSLFQCGAQYQLSDIMCDENGTHTCVHRPSTGPCVVVNQINTCDPVTSYCDAKDGTCKPWLSLGASCVFPSSGIDPCGPWHGCPGSVCVADLGVCTPE